MHLALNPRFTLLGLYEDGFPLSNCYTAMFGNVLKRTDPQLHQHLFSKLALDSSIWVFKWFLTYYIYSFPFEVIKYIWNLVVEIGGIGLVAFAVALVTQMREDLLGLQDPCDASIYFQELKNIEIFNERAKISIVLERANQIKLCSFDLKGLGDSFYARYFEALGD